jgi:hypothetical protein
MVTNLGEPGEKVIRMKLTDGAASHSTIPARTVAAPPVYRPQQVPAGAPPVYRPLQGAGVQQRPATAPPVYRPQPVAGIQQRPAGAPPVYRPAMAAPAAPVQGNTLQAVRKSGKRKHKLQQRSALHRADQSDRDKREAADAQLRKQQQGNLYQGLDADTVAWEMAKTTTGPHLPAKSVVEVEAASRVLQNMGLEADTRFVGPKGRKIVVRYDEQLPALKHNRRVGHLAQTFTHELYVHGGPGPVRDDPDQDHLDMHDPATRDAYLVITKDALAALHNKAQERAFLEAWKRDMHFQIDTEEDLTDTERRKRREWVNARYTEMMPR